MWTKLRLASLLVFAAGIPVAGTGVITFRALADKPAERNETLAAAQEQTKKSLSSLEELAQRAKVIKPSAKELKWQQIPWLTDLTAAQRVALKEKRPIFLWVTGDDPLERC